MPSGWDCSVLDRREYQMKGRPTSDGPFLSQLLPALISVFRFCRLLCELLSYRFQFISKNGGKENSGRVAEVFSILSIERRAATPAIRQLRLSQARSAIASCQNYQIDVPEIL